MYMTFISTDSKEKFLFEDLNVYKKALVIAFFIVSSLKSFLLTYIDLLSFMAAVAIHDITNRIDTFLYAQRDIMNIRSVLALYEHMLTEVNKINAINSRVMLFVYLEALTWLSQTSVAVMEESNWLSRFFVFRYYILYGFTFILAAEANRKVNI